MAYNCTQFDCQQETILEFIERFKVQCAEQLTQAGDDDIKKAGVLVKALPVSVITDLQRRISPTKLSEATFTVIENKLTAQFQVKHSIVGATVKFLNYKQSADDSIENYAKTLNNLATACNYNDCCRDRMLRDVFVSGLYSSAVLRSVLQDCETKTFNQCVEHAKVIEQVAADAQDIKVEPHCTNSAYRVSSDTNIPHDYICIRCGAKSKHLAKNCFALNLSCNTCKKKGHISRVCKSKQSRTHAVRTADDECDGAMSTNSSNTQAQLSEHLTRTVGTAASGGLCNSSQIDKHNSNLFCNIDNCDCSNSSSFLG